MRVTAGTKPELVVLMDIPNVKAHRARLLYAAGLRTAEAVAGSTEATLMSILAKGESASALCGITKPPCPFLPKVSQRVYYVVCRKGLCVARRTTAERASFLYAVGLDTAEALVGSIEATLMSILAKGESASVLCGMSAAFVLCKKGDNRES